MPKNRRRRDKFNIKKYVTKRNLLISGIAVVVVVAILLIILLQSSIYTAKKDTISFKHSTQGVIIRNEKLYKTDVSSRTKLVTEEGASVSKGDVIAEVYTKDYSQSVIDDLNTCEKKILDYLRNNLLKDVLNKDLDALDKQIDELSDEIRAAIISGNDSQLSNYYTQLCTLMNQRQEFLRKQVNEDDELKSLYKQETALLAQIESWTKFSIAEEDGVVSYYFDGAEASLTPENMLDLTANEILNIQNGKSYYTLAASTESIPLYRLVNPNDWYVAVVSNEKIEEFENKSTAFTVDFTAGKGEKVTAKIFDSKEDGGKYIYYLHFDSYNENLLTPRYIELTVSCDYVGTVVPDNAIKTVDGEKGIYVRQDGEKKFVEVNVLIQKDGEACIEPVDITVDLGEECEVFI